MTAKGETPWTPPPEIAAKMPDDVSGNTVNGLGEADRRPPTPIMWHQPKRIPKFAAIQQEVNDRYESEPLLTGIFDTPDRREPPAPIATTREPGDAGHWTHAGQGFRACQ